MIFGKLLKKIESNKKPILTFYFSIGTALIIVLFITYVQGFQKRASLEAKIVPNLISQFMYLSGYDDFEPLIIQYILEEIIAKIDYPIIITNEKQIPIFWKNIGIDETTQWHTLPPQQRAIALRKLNRMKEKNYKIVLTHTDNSDHNTEKKVIGYTFYEDSKIIKRLKVLPYIELFFIVIFILIGLYGLSLAKRNEKKMIWVGLAKETAHQFGTPISSLQGWIDFLKVKIETIINPSYQTENNQANNIEFIFNLQEILDDMSSDITLLNKVASRFGKVGSTINLNPNNIDNVINQSIEYFKKRLPHFNNYVNIHYICKDKNTFLDIDIELMQWAIENLLKNCIDAMQNKSGDIIITSFKYERKYCILIKDEGIGINKSMYNKIFEPGITTKTRGWGLGLSLTKRIIEEFHFGKIKVLESTLNEGTTFEILLPLLEKDYSLKQIIKHKK